MNCTEAAPATGYRFGTAATTNRLRYACIGLVLLAFVARVEVARADVLYVANLGTQTAPAPTIEVFSVDANHMLTWRQTVPLSQFPARALLVQGSTLYATASSGRVLRFTIDVTTGTLTPGPSVAAGSDPRGMASDGRTLFVANNSANSLSVFAINPQNGALKLIQTVNGITAPDQLAIVDTSPQILVSSGTVACTFRIKSGTSLRLLQCSPSGHQAGQPASSIVSLGKVVYFTQFTSTGFGTLTGVGAFGVNPETGQFTTLGQTIPFGVLVLYEMAASPRDKAVFLARNGAPSGGISTLSPEANPPFREVAFLPIPGLAATTLLADPKGKTLYAASPTQNQILSLGVGPGGTLSIAQTVTGTAGGFPLSLALLSQ